MYLQVTVVYQSEPRSAEIWGRSRKCKGGEACIGGGWTGVEGIGRAGGV